MQLRTNFWNLCKCCPMPFYQWWASIRFCHGLQTPVVVLIEMLWPRTLFSSHVLTRNGSSFLSHIFILFPNVPPAIYIYIGFGSLFLQQCRKLSILEYGAAWHVDPPWGFQAEGEMGQPIGLWPTTSTLAESGLSPSECQWRQACYTVLRSLGHGLWKKTQTFKFKVLKTF